MSKNPNIHANFFTSLKHLHKRFKLENPSPQSSSQSLSSPLFLPQISHQPNQISNPDFSETPLEFLSNSIDFPQTQQNPHPQCPQYPPQANEHLNNTSVDDDLGLLVELLGLSDCERGVPNVEGEECCCCRCEDGFYERIVGVKGPKCGREVERLESWIRRFEKEGSEPLRMAHLLLGKAAYIGGDSVDGGLEGLEFPSTVVEFLQVDPPC